MSSSSSRCCWTAHDAAAAAAPIDCVCLGTGRFLRAVLVPALAHSGQRSALIQPRGRTFLDSIHVSDVDADVDGAKTYPVDTVLATGEVETAHFPIYGAFSLGRNEDREAVFDWLGTCRFSCEDDRSGGGLLPRVLGVGVTEAGLSGPETPVMKDLYEVLCCLHKRQASQPSHQGSASSSSSTMMSVINTDNVPFNGDVIKAHMLHLARQSGDESMVPFLSDRVYFHNSMVDRITSHRHGEPLVPRAEPVPAKAMVVLDPLGLLKETLQGAPGVVLRKSSWELQNDVDLKLRVANGTHTALAHLLALLGIAISNHVINPPPPSGNNSNNHNNRESETKPEPSPTQLIVQYLDALVEGGIVPAWVSGGADPTGSSTHRGEDRERAVRDAWDDWRGRLWHPAFGLSSYFITQNGPAKGGIRLGPTVRDLILSSTRYEPTSNVPVTVAFAFAVLLRWLTPRESGNSNGVYRGWLQPSRLLPRTRSTEPNHDVEYADGLRYNLQEGWYEFRCACAVSRNDPGDREVLSDWLASEHQPPKQPMDYCDVIRSYLLAAGGGNLTDVAAKRPVEMETLVKATATLYARMVAGDDLLELLREMADKQGVYKEGLGTSCSALVDDVSVEGGRPLHYRETPIPDSSGLLRAGVSVAAIKSVVASEVASVQVIDIHTHLLPPSHGPLCLWGIDELLTYHYLVAEYFMVAPSELSPEAFYAMPKAQQANLIWDSLFVQRSPISEACRGVVTTLERLGLQSQVDSRDLEAIRGWYRQSFPRERENSSEAFSALVHTLAGVRYNIMTNVPFNPDEAKYWREKKPHCRNYRSSVRVDPLLMGDTHTVKQSLECSGYETTLEGARQYLRDWCDVIKPEYMMASTPHDFTWVMSWSRSLVPPCA